MAQYINAFVGALVAFQEAHNLTIEQTKAVLGFTDAMWVGFFKGALHPGPEQWRKVAQVTNWSCGEFGELILKSPRQPSVWAEVYGSDRNSDSVVHETPQLHAQGSRKGDRHRSRDNSKPRVREDRFPDEDLLQTDRLLPVGRGGSGPSDDVHRTPEGEATTRPPAQEET